MITRASIPRSRHARGILALALATLVPCAAPAAMAAQPAAGSAERSLPTRVLIGPGLEERVGVVTSLGSDKVMFRSVRSPSPRAGAARESVVPSRDVIAMAPILGDAESLALGSGGTGSAAPEPRTGWIEMVDGQVLPGSPGGAAVADRVTWTTRLWGDIRINLEGVSRVVINPGASERLARGRARTGQGTATEDRILLINGDILAGFVESISGQRVVIDSAGAGGGGNSGGGPQSVELSRVATITLASPAQAPGGTRVWLYDGTVARTTPPRATGASMQLAPDGPFIERVSSEEIGALDLSEVRALVMDASRLVALGSLASRTNPDATRPEAARRWTPPLLVGPSRLAPLATPEIELPGPMAVVWTLPPDATHVSMRLELPEDARVFGDCVVRVGLDGDPESQVEARLWSQQPSTDVRLAIKPGTSHLVVNVDPGERGSIQDRVLIRRGLVLLDQAK